MLAAGIDREGRTALGYYRYRVKISDLWHQAHVTKTEWHEGLGSGQTRFMQ